MAEYRLLSEHHFAEVVSTLQAGFSDYIVNFNLDAEGYRSKFLTDGVDLDYSVGAFEDQKLVGVIVNAIRTRDGKKAAYNASTAVRTEARRRGHSSAMMNTGITALRDRGVAKYVLEVIEQNEPAVGLYKKFGFEVKKHLGVFSQKEVDFPETEIAGLTIREEPFEAIESSSLFEDSLIAWQNSNDTLKAAIGIGIDVRCLAARIGRQVVGVGVFLPGNGRVARLCVEAKWRRRGIGLSLLREAKKKSSADLSFLNVDLANTAAQGILEFSGFERILEQFEMELDLQNLQGE